MWSDIIIQIIYTISRDIMLILWFLLIQVYHSSGKTVDINWERVRLFDKEVAQMFLNMLKGHEKTK